MDGAQYGEHKQAIFLRKESNSNSIPIKTLFEIIFTIIFWRWRASADRNVAAWIIRYKNKELGSNQLFLFLVFNYYVLKCAITIRSLEKTYSEFMKTSYVFSKAHSE